MSRSYKLPITTEKAYVRSSGNSLFRKKNRQFIKSHFNDICDVTYMCGIPIPREILKSIKYHRYKWKCIPGKCGITTRKYRCYHWDGAPINDRLDICKECRANMSRKK